ncbi:MAG: hypothetical protein IT376_04830 [Polyangiaceae bacterium]|nr:hypothetical protein [Polyangiaceae bacterium]
MQPPRDLTLPEPGSTTLRAVLGAFLRRNLADLLRLPLGRFATPVFDAFSDVRLHLERLSRTGGAPAVYAATRRVGASTFIACLQRELWGEGDVRKLDAWLTELTATLGVELARLGELPAGGLLLRQPARRVLSVEGDLLLELLPGATLGLQPGRLVVASGGSTIELELARLPESAPLPGAALTRPSEPIVEGLYLACADDNPLASHEAHPEKHGNAVDLGGRSRAEWVRSLRASVELVDALLPDLGRELRLVMQALVPVGWHEERHLSASYAEAIGKAYLTLHPDPMTMVEALIHEFSHNKLNALFRLDRLLENGFTELVASPVRPDPRPLHGVLLAVHAFVPVARLYERLREEGHELARSPRFEPRFQQIVAGNHAGTRTLLARARATPVGQGLVDELARWDEHFAYARGTATAEAPVVSLDV